MSLFTLMHNTTSVTHARTHYTRVRQYQSSGIHILISYTYPFCFCSVYLLILSYTYYIHILLLQCTVGRYINMYMHFRFSSVLLLSDTVYIWHMYPSVLPLQSDVGRNIDMDNCFAFAFVMCCSGDTSMCCSLLPFAVSLRIRTKTSVVSHFWWSFIFASHFLCIKHERLNFEMYSH